MAKLKKIYYCQNCGARHNQWMGQCPACGSWNTIVEEVVSKQEAKRNVRMHGKTLKPLGLDEIEARGEYRISTGNKELDRVLGGGMVPGSVVLIGGEPGIGKSTLVLQTALDMPFHTLYVAGEESPGQIKLRAERLKGEGKNLKLLPETNVQKILAVAKEQNPEIIIVDSIQTLHSDLIESSPGSVSQIRETASDLIRYAKETGTVVFIIGHITKEGMIAGPKVLEHMVDTVLHFEGDRYHQYRLLRSLKNRFGSTHELGIFEMTDHGLTAVENPSGILLSLSDHALAGSVAAVATEGIRSFVVEVQALTGKAVYGTPQRSVTGYDPKRLNMILAVLEKRNAVPLTGHDVFLNIAGGFRLYDPGLDLAVAAAVLSSFTEVAVPAGVAFAGEIGLTGEIRPVSRIEQRIAEAVKSGFKQIAVSAHHHIHPEDFEAEIIRLKDTEDLKRWFV